MASSSASASASSSTSTDSPLKEKYDVFLSFRGPDTRRTFTSHLKKALDDKNIDTYIDYDIKRGEEIEPALLEAIERSTISVIVFSENYASSRWCLDELVHILECRKHVIPIFYNTVVSDISDQNGSYELDERFKDRTESERLKWKDALKKASNIAGFSSKKYRDDAVVVQEVVESVDSIVKKLGFESSSYESKVLVGVERRVQQIESLLCIDSRDDRVRTVVIWGMGGIGKTTLADAVFHRLSSQFDACCFLADVREGSGTQRDLRKELLRELLGDKDLVIKGKTLDRSTAKKLSCTKVLVVLDDVDKSSQLEMLAGRGVTFGSGSRIIITSRDKQRATEMESLREGGNHDIEIYEIEKLNDDEARQFVKSNSSAGFYSEVDSTNYLTKMVTYAAGCPLALKIWSSLSRKHSWDEMTKKLNEKMGSIYGVSYDVLGDDEKEIFLDMACFHKGEQINDVRGYLNCRGFNADSGIDELIGRSLIEVRENHLWMHDVIQEMGREIVRKQCPEEAGKRTRLYSLKDICHVLQHDTGTETIKIMSIVLNDTTFHWTFKINLTRQVFGKMYNLTFLDLGGVSDHWSSSALQLPQGLESLPNVLRYLSWPYYPLGTLPSKFSPSCLVELHMRYSKLQTVWNTDQKPQLLKKIDLSYSSKLVDVPYLTACLESIDLKGCESLVQVPNLSESRNIVSIDLQWCEKLVEVPSYFENLHKLTFLNLSFCQLLKRIPEMPSNLEFLLIGGKLPEILDKYMELSGLPSSIWSLKKLVELDLSGCHHIENLPSSIWTLNSLTSLDLSYTRIEGLPSSIECLSRVISIDLKNCERLVSLSTSICKLKYLEILDLSDCSSFKLFPEISEPMGCLKTLRLRGTEIEELPDSIENLVGLTNLDLSECFCLKSVPNSIYKLRFLKYFSAAGCSKLEKLPISSSNILWSLSELGLSSCTSLEEIPDGLMICLTSLEELDFSEAKIIKSIPTSIKELSGLRSLYIWNCENLESLPELPYNLKLLDADGCRNLEMVSSSTTAVKQGLDQICDEDTYGYPERYSFRNCKKLSETAKSNMMNDAELRIMRMATAFSKCGAPNPVQKKLWPRWRDEDYYSIAIVYPGNEIPERFRYQTEGSSINIKLHVHPSHTNTNFWQLVLCAVLTVDEEKCEKPRRYIDCIPDFIHPKCKFNFTTNNGGSSELDSELDFTVPLSDMFDADRKDMDWDDKSQVFVWYCAHWSTHVRYASEASFNFYLPDYWDSIKVKRCGVCLLSSEGQDVKFVGVNQDVGEPKPEQVISRKRSRDQYEASGSATVALLDLFH